MATILPSNATVEIEGAKTYFDWVSEASGGAFFPSMLFGIFIILFMNFKAGTSNGNAFVGSAFICMIAGIFLTALGWMSSKFMYATILLVAIGAVWAFLEGKNE
jgi:hypothetical protein